MRGFLSARRTQATFPGFPAKPQGLRQPQKLLSSVLHHRNLPAHPQYLSGPLGMQAESPTGPRAVVGVCSGCWFAHWGRAAQLQASGNTPADETVSQEKQASATGLSVVSPARATLLVEATMLPCTSVGGGGSTPVFSLTKDTAPSLGEKESPCPTELTSVSK